MSGVNGSHPVGGSSIVINSDRPKISESVSSDSPRGAGAIRYLGLVGFLLAVLAFGRWYYIETDASPILTYVSMVKPLEKAVYFKPDKAAPGEVVQIVFNRTKWFDTTYTSATLIFHVTCMMEIERGGTKFIEPARRDFPAYQINVPINAGEVPTKSRPFEVPADCLPGTLVYRGFARHDRGPLFSDKETRDLPEVFLTVHK